MEISNIKIKNYRNFKDNEIEFNSKVNVIIGHNNAGKTNLIKALQLVLDRGINKKPTVDDFCKSNKDYTKPPRIEIAIQICESEGENEKDGDSDTVFNWLLKENPKYLAQLTYIYQLPTKYLEDYKSEIISCKDENDNFIQEKCLRLINKKFISKYVARIYGGKPESGDKADPEYLNKFDFQFLDAIRDAERQMFYGDNSLLREVLNYFMDYDLTEGNGFENLTERNKTVLRERENAFQEKSKDLLEHLIERIGKDQLLQYSKDTGAEKGGKPNFDAEISEQELLFALRLIIEKMGFKLPLKNNGLGYNNLLYIAFILAKMQMESSEHMGDNASVYPILAIEEPEAHLHPSMQTKLLQFLKSNEQARQIFITSHSTHITSAVSLDNIICLYEDENGDSKAGYPGKVFSTSKEDQASKLYVQRFLDATKSNMLFANKLILVEGLAEQLLVPCFAAYLELEDKLINDHTCIISMDGKVFKHFLKLYAYNATENPYAINRKIVCITDADPSIKKGEKWISAYPFELDETEKSKKEASHINKLRTSFDEYNNISVFYPNDAKGKTLEYELAKFNPDSKLLITDSFPTQNSPHTKDKYEALINDFNNGLENLTTMYSSYFNKPDENRILTNISTCTWENEEDKKKAFIAAIYYKIVSNAKGEHAFYLERNLRKNLEKGEDKEDFNIPTYIKDALEKITE